MNYYSLSLVTAISVCSSFVFERPDKASNAALIIPISAQDARWGVVPCGRDQCKRVTTPQRAYSLAPFVSFRKGGKGSQTVGQRVAVQHSGRLAVPHPFGFGTRRNSWEEKARQDINLRPFLGSEWLMERRTSSKRWKGCSELNSVKS